MMWAPRNQKLLTPSGCEVLLPADPLPLEHKVPEAGAHFTVTPHTCQRAEHSMGSQ